MKGYKELLFENPSFLRLWLGQVFSEAGLRIYQMSMLWWILSSYKGSGKEVGVFMVASALPSLVFVKAIGRMVDRWEGRNILILCSGLAFFLMALVAFSLGKSFLNLPGALFFGFIAALLQACLEPTLNKALGQVVSEEDLGTAVAFQSSTQSLANFGGAVAGAILIDRIGIYGVIQLNCMVYLISCVLNSLVHFRPPPFCAVSTTSEKVLDKTPDRVVATEPSPWSILESQPLVKRILIGFGFVNFFATPTLVILPVYTKETLHASASILGLLEAGLWVGLLAGTFSSGWIGFSKSAVRTGAICLGTMGFCFFLLGLVQKFFVCLTSLFVAGLALGINNVRFITLFQEMIDFKVKGRFFALMQALISFTFPIAYFLFGFLADWFTPPFVCLIQGLGVMSLAFYFLYLSRVEGLLKSPERPVLAVEALPLL